MECGLRLNESRRGGVIISPFLKLLCGVVIKQSPKLPWMELVEIKSKLLRIDGKRLSRMIVSYSVMLVLQLCFQPLKLSLRELL